MGHSCSRVKLTITISRQQEDVLLCGDWSCPVWRQPGYKLLNISDL